MVRHRPESTGAVINGVHLNYRQVGEGDDLILVHGLAANHAFWNMLLLLPLAHRFRVTIYDLRGHGYSDMPTAGYTPAEMATDLIGLMDHLKIERAHLAGHSFGGLIALQAAAFHSSRVRSLFLLDSRVRALQPSQKLSDWPDGKAVQAHFRSVGIDLDENEDDFGMTLLEKLASPEYRDRKPEPGQQGLFTPFRGWAGGSRSAERWLRMLRETTAREDFREVSGLTVERIRQVHQPTRAIYGERSRCLTSRAGLERELPACATEIVPGVGHFFPVIKPKFVAEKLLAFLDGLGGVANGAVVDRAGGGTYDRDGVDDRASNPTAAGINRPQRDA